MDDLIYPSHATAEWQLPSGLPLEVRDMLRCIPGVGITTVGTRLWAPIGAAPKMAEVMSAIPGSQLVRVTPPISGKVAAEQFMSALVRSELDPLIWPSWLLPFQKEAIFWAWARGSAHIWGSPGCGKTVMAIVWALLFPGDVVVVTKSAVRLQWLLQVRRFCPTLQPFVVKAAGDVRKKDRWHSTTEYLQWARASRQRAVIIVGWEGLSDWLSDEATVSAVNGFSLGVEERVRQTPAWLMAEGETPDVLGPPQMVRDELWWRPSTVVFDEVHMGKGERRIKWEVALEPEGDFPLEGTPLVNRSASAALLASWARHRLGTTATPVGHRMRDLWGQLSLIQPESWGLTSRRFLLRYCAGHDGKYGGIDAEGTTNFDELAARLKTCAFQIPYSVSHGQLPPKRRMISVIPASALAKGAVGDRELNREIQTLSMSLGRTGDERAKSGAIARLNELRLMEAASLKRGVVMDKVREYREVGKGKVIVFTGRKVDVDALAGALTKSFAPGALWAATGEDSMEERARVQAEFMAHPGPCVLIGTHQCWGQSFNLQDADVLLLAMLVYTPWELEQIEGRVQRLGMTRSCLIEYLIGEGTYDQRVKSIVLDKMPAVEMVTGGESSIAGLAGDLRNDAGREARLNDLAARIAAWSDDDWSDDD